MHPRSLAVQPERSEAKSKAGPPTLRLRRWRGYAQSEQENNPGCTRVKTAISRRLGLTVDHGHAAIRENMRGHVLAAAGDRRAFDDKNSGLAERLTKNRMSGQMRNLP